MPEITEITVQASRKKQFERYEPGEESVELTAELEDDEDLADAFEKLDERAWQLVDRGLMRRFEAYLQENDE
jgi:hypothetical protein